MEFEKELAEVKAKQQDVVNQINDLERRKQMLLQEALRLDGEARLLNRLRPNKSREPKQEGDKQI